MVSALPKDRQKEGQEHGFSAVYDATAGRFGVYMFRPDRSPLAPADA